MRLGDFLLMRGKVSRSEISAACRMQKVNNQLIGVLAFDRGMLSTEQLARILVEQAGSRPRRLFGEIAIGLGYLTRVQVESLLEIQAENRLRIGEILVLQSRLTEHELIEELAEYRKHLAEEQERSA